jgi:GNAT superfamily N-acetyltransferase
MDVDGSVIVRAALADDLARIRSLHGQLYPELGVTDERTAAGAWAVIAATPVARSRWPRSAVSSSHHGCDGAGEHGPPGGARLLVENVVVDRLHRRHGVGAALLEVAAALGRAAGCYKLQLSAEDRDAFAFYEAAG